MKFADAQKKMIEYLDSKEFKEREDAEDTLGSIPILQRLIKYGLITTGSQEGSISTGYNPSSKRYYRIEERAFIIGFMKSEKAYECMNHINTYTDKIGFIVRSEPSKEFEKEFYEGDVKGLSNIPVTVSGISKTDRPIKVLYPDSRLQAVMPSSSLDKDKKSANLSKSEDTVFVTIIDPVYGRKAASKDGLYRVVLDALKTLI